MSPHNIVNAAGLLAEVIRGDLVESAHLGHLVVLAPDGEPAETSQTLTHRHPAQAADRRSCRIVQEPTGVNPTGRDLRPVFSVGDPDAVIYARSALKPLQAIADLECGFNPSSDALLALACSSHSGEPEHLAGVRAMLAEADLDESALQNTPDFPLDSDASLAWRAAGHPKASIAQNCSGKHAAMLCACAAAGWDVDTYRDPAHPLQQVIAETIATYTGDGRQPVVTVDGCGAPLFSTTLVGLARAFSRIATASPGTPAARVADAMRAHPEMVGGTGRDVTLAMQAVPGLICKDGAEGVYAGALPNGAAFAFKILDGSARARSAILVRALELMGAFDVPGADVDALRELGNVPVLGHGAPVGQVKVAF